MDSKRRKNQQMELAFSVEGRGEALMVTDEGTEGSMARRKAESLAVEAPGPAA